MPSVDDTVPPELIHADTEPHIANKDPTVEKKTKDTPKENKSLRSHDETPTRDEGAPKRIPLT